jgi:CRP-like cAMP-binding protein
VRLGSRPCPEPGDLFGEVGFFDGLPRSADVVALEESEAFVLTQAAFQRLRLTHPRLALRFVLDLGRVLGERFRASDARRCRQPSRQTRLRPLGRHLVHL